MSHNFIRYVFVALVVFVAGCATNQTQLNPDKTYSTESGFRFKVQMSGEWYPGQNSKGLYTFGQKPLLDGTTKMAAVRHGAIWTPGGKAMTNKEIFDGFKRDIEKDAKSGRGTNIKSTFKQMQFKGADCLSFEQSGEDHPAQGPMNMINEGVICLHPKRKYQFIWLAINERRPKGKPVSEVWGEDKKTFLESLEFFD